MACGGDAQPQPRGGAGRPLGGRGSTDPVGKPAELGLGERHDVGLGVRFLLRLKINYSPLKRGPFPSEVALEGLPWSLQVPLVLPQLHPHPDSSSPSQRGIRWWGG